MTERPTPPAGRPAVPPVPLAALPPAAWRLEHSRTAAPRSGGVTSTRRIVRGGRTVAHGATDADARRLLRILNAANVLLVTLELVRDLIAAHSPDFDGRAQLLRLIETAVRFGRSTLR